MSRGLDFASMSQCYFEKILGNQFWYFENEMLFGETHDWTSTELSLVTWPPSPMGHFFSSNLKIHIKGNMDGNKSARQQTISKVKF